MNASKQVKVLLAGIATVAVMGAAMAQGNPPNPAVKNAPEGAGQQSSQNTPMGTTGTPSGAPMSAGKAPMAKSSTMGTANAGTSGNSTSMGTSSTSTDTTVAADTTTKTAKMGKRHHMRKARADRN
jgi:hypothetical protein